MGKPVQVSVAPRRLHVGEGAGGAKGRGAVSVGTPGGGGHRAGEAPRAPWFRVSGSHQLVLGSRSLRRSERPRVPAEGFCQGAGEGSAQARALASARPCFVLTHPRGRSAWQGRDSLHLAPQPVSNYETAGSSPAFEVLGGGQRPGVSLEASCAQRRTRSLPIIYLTQVLCGNCNF